jgi:hypothetical protein
MYFGMSDEEQKNYSYEIAMIQIRNKTEEWRYHIPLKNKY